MDPGEQPAEQDFSKLHLIDRVRHKVWKARVSGYEEAARQFSHSADESDACFRPWLQDTSLWKSAVVDSNVVAHEQALVALNAFLEFGGRQAATSTRAAVMPGLIDKGLSSSRAGTKQKASSAISWYIELDQPELVLDDLISGLSSKLPKLVASTTATIRDQYRQFGARAVPARPTVKQIPKLFAHSDKNVRKEASDLALELYRWLGDGIRPLLLNDLKPIQVKELEATLQTVESPGQATPERYLWSQRPSDATAEPTDTGEPEPANEQADPMDLIDAVDISSEIPRDFPDQINSTKWKDRKESLDNLLKVVSVPKIADHEYSEIVRLLAKSMKDANIMCVSVAADCIEAMANGLGGNFAKYRPIVVGPMLERFKEKKQNVVEAISRACDAVFKACGLSSLLDELIEFCAHKNPQVKSETLNFLVRCLQSTPEYPTKPEQKSIAETCVKLLGDTFEPVRMAAAQVMGTLMKILGERAMNPYLEHVEDLRKPKIKEFFDTASVVAKPRKEPVAAATQKSVRPTGTPKKPTTTKKVIKKQPASTAASAPAPAKQTETRPVQSGLKPPSSRLGMGARSPDRKTPNLSSANPSSSARSLTGRTLQKPSTSATENLSKASSAEIEDLRKSKTDLDERVQSLTDQNKSYLARITELETENHKLQSDRTESMLLVTAKETQITRLRTERISAQERVHQLEHELDTLRAQSTRLSSPSRSHPPSSAGAGRRSSSSFIADEKENIPSYKTAEPAPIPTSEPPVTSTSNESSHYSVPSNYSNSGSTNTRNFKSASELSMQLKARIEQMRRADRSRTVSRNDN